MSRSAGVTAAAGRAPAPAAGGAVGQAVAAVLRRVRAAAWLPWLGALVAAGTVAVGLWLDARGTQLGVPHPPTLGGWAPRAHPLAWVAVPLVLLGMALVPWLARARLRPAAFALAILALTLVLRLALAAVRGGTGAWSVVFDLERSAEARNEYLAALGAFTYGPGFFLDRFAELVPALPVHVAGHPPGLVLTMHALGIDTAGELAALCIAAGALSAPLTYALGRTLLDERAARLAGLLVAVAPGALDFGATSADAVYLLLGLLAAWPLAARGLRARVAGAVLLAVGACFAWSLLAVGAWAVLLALLREGWRAALVLAALCAVAVLAGFGLLAALTGFDPIGTLAATEQVYRLGIASRRPYAFWLFGSPVAFLLVLGLPIAWLALRAAGEGHPVAVTILAVLLVAAVLGFTKAETERIWLFFAPFVCLAAAVVLARAPRALAPVAALLAVQAVVYELLFGTVW